MIEIIRKRQEGKTSTLIDLSERNQIPIVVGNERRRVFLRQAAVRLKKSIPDPLVCGESLRGYRGKIYVDDLDACKYITQYYPNLDDWAGYSISTENIIGIKKSCDEMSLAFLNASRENEKLKEDLALTKEVNKSQETLINTLTQTLDALREQNKLLKEKEKKE